MFYIHFFMSKWLISSFLMSDVSESLSLLTKKEQWERIAQVVHQKRATMSDSLRSLRGNEWSWGNRSGHSFFWANRSFAHFFAKNERISQKADEQIPSSVNTWKQHIYLRGKSLTVMTIRVSVLRFLTPIFHHSNSGPLFHKLLLNMVKIAWVHKSYLPVKRNLHLHFDTVLLKGGFHDISDRYFLHDSNPSNITPQRQTAHCGFQILKKSPW